MRRATVRMFVPGVQTPQRDWMTIAERYVQALVNAGWGPDLLLFGLPAVMFEGSPWLPFRDLFVGGLADRFINVICGVTPIPQQSILSGLEKNFQLSFKKQHGRDPTPEELKDLKEPLPEPDIVRLYTVGVPNIAIVGVGPRELTSHEVSYLKRYTRVIVPALDTDKILLASEANVDCVCPPSQFPGLLAHYRPR